MRGAGGTLCYDSFYWGRTAPPLTCDHAASARARKCLPAPLTSLRGGKSASRATLRCASALRCAKWDVSCDGGNALSCVALGEAMCLDWVKGDLAQLQAPQSGSAGGRGERERDMMIDGWCPQSTVVTCHPLINDDTGVFCDTVTVTPSHFVQSVRV